MTVIHFSFIAALVVAAAMGLGHVLHSAMVTWAGFWIGLAIGMGGPKLWNATEEWRFRRAWIRNRLPK